MDNQDFARRLQALEDIESIKTLHREYVFRLNAQEWDKVVEFFAENAEVRIFRHPYCKGIAQIRAMFFEHMSKVNFGKNRDCHFATMPVIDLKGDMATSHWMLYIFISDPETGNALRWTQGRYECEYAKLNGQWKFSKVVWINPWPRLPRSLPTIEDVRAMGFDA